MNARYKKKTRNNNVNFTTCKIVVLGETLTVCLLPLGASTQTLLFDITTVKPGLGTYIN